MKTFFKVWLGIGLIALGIGIAVVVLAFASGASWEDVPTYSVNESYEGISNLDFDISYGSVKIVEGDTFTIDAANMYDDSFESYVTDGTWYITEDYGNSVNLFGWRFSLRQITEWHHDISPHITITLPKDFVADSVTLKVGAGEATAEAINTSKGSFSVDAGRLQIDQIRVTDQSEYNVGAGEMILNNLTAKDVIMDCGIGNIEVDGVITGDNDISCGIGRIRMDINGEEEDYSYDISSDIGDVVINGRSYHDRTIDHNAENNLNLDCGIGNITIEFH
jgi:hypothetical protein